MNIFSRALLFIGGFEMPEDYSYFKLKHTINNPLRIFFLCGSFFNTNKDEKLDKRIVLKKYIESLNPNYKCLILEENFMFRRSSTKLNYNDIAMKSLKNIEFLTSLMSDKVLIFHESISTAAEIGLFSSDKTISDKMIILAPDVYSVEEDVISGFLNLSYNNRIFPDYNLEIIRYYPGTYSYRISNKTSKFHTYFVNNVIGDNLKSKLDSSLEISDININIEKRSRYNAFKDDISKYYITTGGELNVTFNIKHLISLMISLFSMDEVKRNLREPIYGTKNEIEVKKNVLYKAIKILKKFFTDLIVKGILSTNPNFRFKEVKFEVNCAGITFAQSVSYFIYVMYGINLLDINLSQKKLIITNDLNRISAVYADLIVSPVGGGIAEVLNFE